MSEPILSPIGPRRGELIRLGGRRLEARRRGGVSIGLWLPLTPLWLLLAPLALALAPALRLGPRMRGVNPYRAVLGLGAVLLALSGTQISVDSPRAKIRIRIF